MKSLLVHHTEGEEEEENGLDTLKFSVLIK